MRKIIDIVKEIRIILLEIVGSLKLFRWKTSKKINIDNKIRVGFLIQATQSWNKVSRIYEEMKKDNQFDVFIICVPNNSDEDSSNTYKWFLERKYSCIDARIGKGPWNISKNKGSWFDIKKLQLDYLIYTKPYNSHLPRQYKTSKTSLFTRVCLCPYGIVGTEMYLKLSHRRDFYKDVYFLFAHNIDEAEYNKNNYKILNKLGCQNTVFAGSPALQSFYEEKTTDCDIWKTDDSTRIVWTPRWTTNEPYGGGSNFLRYKDVLLDFASSRKVEFVFRPHPLTFSNFVSEKLMTESDVIEFKKKCNDRNNVCLDMDSEYAPIFWTSDILLTDYSSVLIEYFITGKPIIYCNTDNPTKDFLPYLQELLKVCYVVNNEYELLCVLNCLVAGNDYLKTARLEVVNSIFRNQFENAAKEICEYIKRDRYKNYERIIK